MFNFYLSTSANPSTVSYDECSATQRELESKRSDFDRNFWLCD